MDPLNLAENILYHLMGRVQSDQIAFVKHKNSIYWTSTDDPQSVYSAVIVLLQNLFDQFKDQSFFILRNRIYYSGKLNNMDLGMIKIVAKRGTDNIRPVDHGFDLNSYEFISIQSKSMDPLQFQGANSVNRFEISDFNKIENLTMEKLAKLIPQNEVLHDQDRQIVAVLLSEMGEILSVGFNSNSLNKTLHAEVIMLQKFYHKHSQKIPWGAKILTSHKPCKMCAGMIYEMCQGSEFPFVYYENEMLGPMNSLSILEQKKLLIKQESLTRMDLRQIKFES